jgi:hypothetical protein
MTPTLLTNTRFSDAGRQSVWLDRRCRRPKTCAEAGITRLFGGPQIGVGFRPELPAGRAEGL